MTILLILFAVLPLSLFFFDRQEQTILNNITQQHKITARILAQSTLNIILMNGGDIETTSVDAKEMISVLRPFHREGLVYADAILLSTKKQFNGRVLADIHVENFDTTSMYSDLSLSSDALDRIKNIRKEYEEITLPGVKGRMLEFTAFGALPGKEPLCIGRIMISRDMILAPLSELRNFVFLTSAVAMLIVSFIGFLFSRFISKPVEKLTEAVRYIEEGDYDHKIKIDSRDELGGLAETFNSMSGIIKNKIMELEDTNRALSRMDKLKDEFLANTSHELRTPIHGIIGIADSLIQGVAGDLPSDVRHNLQMIVKSGNRLSRLVNDILDYSKLKHADINLKLSRVDMHSLTEVVFSILKPLAQNKYIILKNRIEPGEAYVYGDENRIQQILFNLVGNAIKFTDEGEVTVRTVMRGDNPEVLEIHVQDSGIGIPPDRVHGIFDSFQQGDGSISRKYGGTGLGLAITRDLVTLHGGTIRVESIPGHGSTFIFTLPLTDKYFKNQADIMIQEYSEISENDDLHLPPDAENALKVLKMESAGSAGTILIVDDEEVNLQVLTNYLSLEGFRIEIASGGVEALNYMEAHELPDMLLLDVMMPVMSGYEVCRILREKYPSYQLPILMLTAKNRTQDIMTGFQAGANDYITKPFDRSELLSRVRNLIGLKWSVKSYNELSLLKEELSIARKIQQAIIPAETPMMTGLTIEALYEPMLAVGGDFYDFCRVDDDIMGIFIADVTGHGVPAAIIGSMLKAAFSMSRDRVSDPAALLKNINDVMFNHISGRFVSACYTFIDNRRGKLITSGAAHWPLYIWRKETREMFEVMAKGRLIGYQENSQYINKEFEMRKGDRICFFTDGIIEERNAPGEMFGEDRFKRYIRENQDIPLPEFRDGLVSALKKWSGHRQDRTFEDDVTLIIVDITE